jgi:hypothetical protein
MSHAFLCRLGAPLPANYRTARRNLHDVKGIFQRYVIVPKNSVIPNIESLILRYPLIGWDIWQKAVYLLTNDVKPPSHFPTFGWWHHRVIDYVRKGLLFHGPEIEREGLGKPWSLHGLLWPKQLETLRTLMSEGGVKTETGPPVTSGRMLRRTFAHE